MPSTRRDSSGSLAPMWKRRYSTGIGGRHRNAGEAGWKVVAGRFVVAYEHPDGGDPLFARVVTVWRRR